MTDGLADRNGQGVGSRLSGNRRGVESGPLQCRQEESPVELLLRRARGRLDRLAPRRVSSELDRGAVLVDIRPQTQRTRDGELPGAVAVCRNVLEWRCDELSPWRDERLCGRRLILICDQGFQSSLAAAALQGLGRTGATDVIGGFQGWLAAGLPVDRRRREGAEAGAQPAR